TLGYDDYPTSQFRVFESGGNTIPFKATENIPWLFLVDVGGFTEDTILVYSIPDLDPGFYVDSIEIASEAADNSPVYVVVSLQVDEAPQYLQTDSSSLYLQYFQYLDAIPTSRFEVSERNGKQINFDVFEDADWLFLNNISGITPDEIDVSISIDMAPGLYVDSIVISSEDVVNSPIYLPVTFEIVAAEPALIDLFPDTTTILAFQNGPLPEVRIVTVHSTNYPFPYTATESIPWLDITGESGVTDGSIYLQITTTSIEPGIIYFDSITVTSEGIQNSPQFAFVRYLIVPDTIPPAAVNDLNVDDITTTSAFLSWTASGDDSLTGTAVETDIRYSTDLTDLEYWVSAVQVEGEPAPLAAGNEENFEVSGLTPGYTYYFALKIIDDAGNQSGISNVDSVFLPPLPPSTPILISPDSGATDVSIDVTFVWHSLLGAETYYVEYDTDSSFSEPYNVGGIEDTTLTAGPLQYATTYYWRVRALNIGGNSEWSSVWSFTTESAPPTISGVIKDIDDEPLADVSVLVYDVYPSGSVLGSTTTDINGQFSFYDISGVVVLYAFKDGYYPLTSSIEAPVIDLLLYLLPTPEFAPSDQWVDLFCDSSYIHGNLIQANDIVEAFD
ncbi:MAG: fibronectin type III domain-containing protein, partial [Candidatus Zixiibacteriota bacterium]